MSFGDRANLATHLGLAAHRRLRLHLPADVRGLVGRVRLRQEVQALGGDRVQRFAREAFGWCYAIPQGSSGSSVDALRIDIRPGHSSPWAQCYPLGELQDPV